MTWKDRIMANLGQYPYTGKFLKDAIQQRLEVRGYTRGMLTAHLVDKISPALTRLEHVLEIGEAHCAGFKSIFEERKLPNRDLTMDSEIVNILAEVKAFEFLYEHGFRDIAKLRRKRDAKTVDFSATRNCRNYAVEVTRLGLAQAKRKKPRHIVEDSLIRHTITSDDKLVGEKVGRWFMSSGKDNVPRIIETIRDAIDSKYPQIRGFIQRQGDGCKGILIISTGRDYFVMNKYAATEFEITPGAVQEAIRQAWKALEQERGGHEYLHHLVVTMGKDLEKAITFPSL